MEIKMKSFEECRHKICEILFTDEVEERLSPYKLIDGFLYLPYLSPSEKIEKTVPYMKLNKMVGLRHQFSGEVKLFDARIILDKIDN